MKCWTIGRLGSCLQASSSSSPLPPCCRYRLGILIQVHLHTRRQHPGESRFQQLRSLLLLGAQLNRH